MNVSFSTRIWPSRNEDGLTNKRLLWNVNIQGFLFATYGPRFRSSRS